MSDIERRIEALERANRRWRYAVGLLGSVLLIVLIGAAKLPDEIPDLLQAKKIQVIAPDGKPVIVLSADTNGTALILSEPGQNHERGITLAAGKEGVALMLMKNKEAPLLSAHVDDNGSSLRMFDGREPSQNPRGIFLRSACATKNIQGGTMISLIRGPRKKNLQAGLFMEDALASSSLFLGGSQGKTVNVRVNQENGKVDFINENKKTIWSSP